MELREFVKATLVQLIEGVKEAQEAAAKLGAAVVPSGQGMQDSLARNRTVSFDIVLNTAESTQTKGGMGILVGPVGVGSRGQSDAGKESESRIRFDVPVYLPSQSIR